MEGREVFVPFLGNFFQLQAEMQQGFNHQDVFVPFLGDFFSIPHISNRKEEKSWKVFVPFPGDFFSIKDTTRNEEDDPGRYVVIERDEYELLIDLWKKQVRDRHPSHRSSL